MFTDEMKAKLMGWADIEVTGDDSRQLRIIIRMSTTDDDADKRLHTADALAVLINSNNQ